MVESVLFASDRPVSLASLKMLFKGTNVRGDKIRRVLDQLAVEYAGGRRGVTLEEVPGGYQLRTKIDNMEFLKRTLKARQFKLSGPALEVLSIVAYKQPVVKNEVDEIRGVESGHLLRALMEKNLVCFEGKSELPGRPMQYGTTRKFLEIFGLRSLKELPTLSQIDELLPEGMDEQQAEEKPTLASITDSMSATFAGSYSQGEEELMKIQEQLEDISTTTNFFEEEKQRQAEKRDLERAQNIRDALAFGEPVSTRDANWLKKYDEALAAGTTLVALASEKKKAFMGGNKEASSVVDGALESAAQDEMAALSEDESSLEGLSLSEEGEELSEEMTEAIAAFDQDEDLDEASEDSLPFLGEADDIDEEEGNSSL
ncbi:MAG: SMC-Scp complex subunit ScpB [Bdellovibrio sp.]